MSKLIENKYVFILNELLDFLFIPVGSLCWILAFYIAAHNNLIDYCSLPFIIGILYVIFYVTINEINLKINNKYYTKEKIEKEIKKKEDFIDNEIRKQQEKQNNINLVSQYKEDIIELRKKLTYYLQEEN